ncbi:MAG: polysaccharide biosynthesis tyrosine autokinase [Pseudomonadota bacterium]
MLRRNRLLIGAFLLAGLGAGFFFLSRAPLQYTAEVSVLSQQSRTPVSDLQTVTAEPGVSSSQIRTQIDILRSPALARRVVERANLLEREEFQPTTSTFATVMAFVTDALGMPAEPVEALGMAERVDLAAAALMARITINNEQRSDVLRIGVTTRDPQLSADVINIFAEEFREISLRRKTETARRTQDWLETRLRDLAARVRESEREVSEFRAANGLRDDGRDRRAARTPNVTEQQLSAVNTQVTAASATRAQLENQAAQISFALRQPNGRELVAESLDSPLLQRLREAEATAAARESEIASRAGARSPDLIAARAQRAGIQARIRQATQNLISNIQSELATARAQEASLRGTLDELRNAVAREQRAEIQLQQYQAALDANRSIFESFLGRAAQLSNISGIQEADAEILSPAVAPTYASGPRKGRDLAIIGILSLVAGLGAAVLRERLRQGFRTPEEFEVETGMHVVGLMPRLSRKARATSNPNADIDAAAALTRLRGTLQMHHDGNMPQVVVVTSAVPEEGKTMLSMGLARSAAEAGLSVLLIDCDMRNPSVAPMLNLPVGPTLKHVLLGQSLGSGERLIHHAPGGVDVIATDVEARGGQDLLSSSTMAALITALRNRYDLIVLDAPPVLVATEVFSLVRVSDAALMATRWDSSPRPVVRGAVRLLRNAGAVHLFGVLTRVNLKRYASETSSSLAFMHRKYRAEPPRLARTRRA